ncbi:ABC transporter ATP-binding protein [Nocardioides zeae]|uniref:ABC transporter ATP-binding protein n=1 Tax=Nocardioides imazamoxiresistens TaxID=3231893 RepID=A0ABU3Q293_9ACTN|nr:ABC transporter ATP-binding protein [Nocardioides zeae]MDT9595266.1 ABC transporter ATP-binding protein [Nocardioides zeae]
MSRPSRVAAPAPAAAPVLAADGVTVGYRDRTILEGLSLPVEAGTITALVGPNGSGKSTLLGALARVLRPRRGAVLLDGASLAELGSRQVARRLALLPQSATVPAGATAWEVVEQGRFPQRGAWSMLRRADDPVVAQALAVTGIEHLAHRRVAELSGGERQRVWIAMAVAQQTDLLLLDEPTTFLDVRHQLDLMRLVGTLRERGVTIVMVLHDLNQAARYADRVVALRDGAVVADGAPADVVTPALLADVFGIDAVVTPDPVSGRPHFHAR